jgi:hypothetical protein
MFGSCFVATVLPLSVRQNLYSSDIEEPPFRAFSCLGPDVRH